MNQLQLNLILPLSDVGSEPLPTQTGYQPDWDLEQEAFFEGDRVLYRGKPATVKKSWQNTRLARIWTDKDFKSYLVPFGELESLDLETVEVGNGIDNGCSSWYCDVCAGNDEAIALDDSVGRMASLPTEKCPSEGHLTFEIGKKYYLKTDGRAVFLEKLYKKRAKVCDRSTFDTFNVDLEDLTDKSIQLELPQGEAQAIENNVGRKQLFPTDFYSVVDEWDLSSLYQMKAYLEHKIRERGYSVEQHCPSPQKSCREKNDNGNLLPTQNNVGRENDSDFLPTQNKDIPHPYIEAKRLPYKTKSGERRYRKKPYYFLRDHNDKGKSTYLCSDRALIPEHLRELTIYGEDETPF